jgi:EMC6
MMSDPLADISGQPGSGGVEDNVTSNTREVIDGIALFNNLARIDRIRSVMGIVSGVIVGITGITGLQGFGTFSF